MTFDPDVHHRRSIRLRGYDYSHPGHYFVTICTHGKEHVFGEVVEGEMVLNEAGEVVRRAWESLPKRFPTVALNSLVVMPNHIHIIIGLVGEGLALPASLRRGAASSAPTLGDVLRVFKSTSAISANALLSRCGQPLWQRNYYEHIIRNPAELEMIREYIATNPPRWDTDPENVSPL